MNLFGGLYNNYYPYYWTVHIKNVGCNGPFSSYVNAQHFINSHFILNPFIDVDQRKEVVITQNNIINCDDPIIYVDYIIKDHSKYCYLSQLLKKYNDFKKNKEKNKEKE